MRSSAGVTTALIWSVTQRIAPSTEMTDTWQSMNSLDCWSDCCYPVQEGAFRVPSRT
jgi:hypothetical protein